MNTKCMQVAELIGALLGRLECTGETLEVYPGDFLNPQMSGWTARIVGANGVAKRAHGDTPEAALTQLVTL